MKRELLSLKHTHTHTPHIYSFVLSRLARLTRHTQTHTGYLLYGIGYACYFVTIKQYEFIIYCLKWVFDFIYKSAHENAVEALLALFCISGSIYAFNGIIQKRRASQNSRNNAQRNNAQRNKHLQTRWQWEDDSKMWSNYNAQSDTLLENTFMANPKTQVILPPGTYMVDFTTMTQKNVRTQRTRRIRRNGGPLPQTAKLVSPPPAISLRSVKSQGLEWSSHVACREITMGKGLSSKCISIPRALQTQRSLDQHHFNIAAMQFCNLLNKAPDKILRVDVYVANTFVENRYYDRRKELKSISKDLSRELWVFHGTSDAKNFDRIMTQGFFIGGGGIIPAKNGAAHGKGVYTATGPSTPMSYARTTNAVILARALEGQPGKDSKRVNKDWLVLRRTDHLLPRYVVYYK